MFRALLKVAVRLVSQWPMPDEFVSLADADRLRVYDASYLWLAMRLDAGRDHDLQAEVDRVFQEDQGRGSATARAIASWKRRRASVSAIAAWIRSRSRVV